MNLRDMAERLFWTLLAAFLGALGVGDLLDISTLDAAITATAAAGVNFLLLVARARLAVLPEPGAGLPGLPVEETVDVNERLRGAGMWDDEPTTPDRGAVAWGTIALCVIAVVAVLYAFGKLPLDL